MLENETHNHLFSRVGSCIYSLVHILDFTCYLFIYTDSYGRRDRLTVVVCLYIPTHEEDVTVFMNNYFSRGFMRHLSALSCLITREHENV